MPRISRVLWAVFGVVGIKKEAPKWRFQLASFLEIPSSVNSQFGFYEVTCLGDCWVWFGLVWCAGDPFV